MFRMTLRAADASESGLEAAAGEELLDGAYDHGAQRSRAGLEALFINADIGIERL
jgi:hypothetical protein